MSIVELSISTVGVIFIILAINYFEKNNKKAGVIFGTSGLILVVFTGNIALFF